MLIHLQIADLAIVSRLELTYDAGMTALTGETGAGKSILIDALALALGDKADSTQIRAGAERAEIVASFDLTHAPAARDWLIEQALDTGEECILRRVLVRGGRARAYINGRASASAQLQALGELLVDIHGQHAHQSLLRPTAQRDLLDAYGAHQALARAVAEAFRRWHTAERQLSALEDSVRSRAERLDLLRFQVEELTTLDLSLTELEALDREQKRLSHLEQLQQDANALLNTLTEIEGNTLDQLRQGAAQLTELSTLDATLEPGRELLESAAIHAEEAAGTLRHYLDGLELDPEALAAAEARLAAIHEIARKYRVFPQQLPELLTEREEELAGLQQADLQLDALRAQRDGAWRDYLAQAAQLGEARTAAAQRLGATVTHSIGRLGMTGGQFSVRLEPIDPAAAGTGGLERVVFLVTANPGQPPQPLAKVASGGELSRISLAIQVATAQCGQVPTLIFDEVDVGIGGGVAEIVGLLLRQLGAARQVLCVTHLPQVAAQANHHLRVRKSTTHGQTHASTEPLAADERVEEIARMLGGTAITKRTRAHAAEMLQVSSDD